MIHVNFLLGNIIPVLPRGKEEIHKRNEYGGAFSPKGCFFAYRAGVKGETEPDPPSPLFHQRIIAQSGSHGFRTKGICIIGETDLYAGKQGNGGGGGNANESACIALQCLHLHRERYRTQCTMPSIQLSIPAGGNQRRSVVFSSPTLPSFRQGCNYTM